ncbi:MAG: ATP-dependent nuclease [Lysobacter sp.]
MSITVSKLWLSNYRSCKDLQVELTRYTALIGYNNSGKSNILGALSWLLKKYSLPASDFWNPGHPVSVTAELTGIDEGDLALLLDKPRGQISPFINGDTLSVRRVQSQPDAKASEVRFEVLDPENGDWRSNPTGIDNALGVLLPDPIKIGAMEDAEEDATKAKTSTTIGKLLSEFTEAIQNAHADELNQHLSEVSRRISSTGDARIAELGVIDDGINRKLQDIFPGMSVSLHFEVPDVGALIKAGTLKVRENDGDERDFGSYGHGAQRSIQMTLIRHLAEVKRGDVTGGTTLLLIDEPELYLHPFAIEQVRVALKFLSTQGYQVVFSTHSAQLIRHEDAQHVLLVRKNTEGETTIRRRLRDAVEIVVPDAQHQTEHLFSLSNSCQFLFAETVLVVEGKTEQKLLPAIYEHHHGTSLGQNRIALISLDGSSNISKTIKILREMDLPTRAIVDLDYIFTRAQNGDLLDDQDPDLTALKLKLEEMGQAGEISLNIETNLPKKGVQGPAAEAYMMLALREDATAHIEQLHQKLLVQGFWLWTRGAIEPHLKITTKNEAAWASFRNIMLTSSYADACQHDAKAMELMDWIAA